MTEEESKKRRRLGQIVCGPPGAGKSTYCDGMIQFFNAIGRKAVLINLDPACSNASTERTFFVVVVVVKNETQTQQTHSTRRRSKNKNETHSTNTLNKHTQHVVVVDVKTKMKYTQRSRRKKK